MSEEQHEIETESHSSGGTEVVVATGEGEETSLVELPDVLPVLPLKNTVLFPFLLSPLLVNTDRSRQLIDHVLRTRERLLVCAAVRRPVEDSPKPDDLHRVGTVMRIAKMLKFPDDSYRLLVQGVARVRAASTGWRNGAISNPWRRLPWCATSCSCSGPWFPRAPGSPTSCRCSPRAWTIPRSSRTWWAPISTST
jgi:hypothetical protein